MEKMFPPKPPLEVVTRELIDKLLTLFGRNGYNNMAMMLVVCDMDTSTHTMSGNLLNPGAQALLSGALAQLLEAEAQEATQQGKMQ